VVAGGGGSSPSRGSVTTRPILPRRRRGPRAARALAERRWGPHATIDRDGDENEWSWQDVLIHVAPLTS
jgi:hypothetical protein